MRKSTKSVLANALRSYINPVHASELQNALRVVDVTNYGNEAIVYFVGYGDPSNSTKFAEQCRHTSGKNVAPDIFFELQMPVTCSHTAFLGNHKNKSRFIIALIASLTHSDIKSLQSRADADFSSVTQLSS